MSARLYDFNSEAASFACSSPEVLFGIRCHLPGSYLGSTRGAWAVSERVGVLQQANRRVPTRQARDESQCSVEIGEFCLVWVSSLTKEGAEPRSA